MCVLSHDLTHVFFRAKKFLSKIEFTKNCLLPEEAEVEEHEAQVQAENAKLKKELEELKGLVAALAAPVPSHAPAHKAAPPSPNLQGPGAVGGAARGAARGAVRRVSLLVPFFQE